MADLEPSDFPWDQLLPAWAAPPAGDAPRWVSLAEAEINVGVSRSALRAWCRTGQIPSRLAEGRHGPQRMVPLDAVVERAGQSPRLQRRAAGALTLEPELLVLRNRVEQLESRLAALERANDSKAG